MDDTPVWVVDINVLVSGLLSPFGPPGRIVDALQARRLRLALDDRIEAEYRDVVARPRLGVARFRQEAFLATLQFQQHVTATPWTYRWPPDEDDTMFLEVALQTSALTVVTGNLRHFPPACRGPVTVRSPRDAWDFFAHLQFDGESPQKS